MKRTSCDFIKVGKEGCKKGKAVLLCDMARHKSKEVTRHVDLLNETCGDLAAHLVENSKEIDALQLSFVKLGEEVTQFKLKPPPPSFEPYDDSILTTSLKKQQKTIANLREDLFKIQPYDDMKLQKAVKKQQSAIKELQDAMGAKNDEVTKLEKTVALLHEKVEEISKKPSLATAEPYDDTTLATALEMQQKTIDSLRNEMDEIKKPSAPPLPYDDSKLQKTVKQLQGAISSKKDEVIQLKRTIQLLQGEIKEMKRKPSVPTIHPYDDTYLKESLDDLRAEIDEMKKEKEKKSNLPPSDVSHPYDDGRLQGTVNELQKRMESAIKATNGEVPLDDDKVQETVKRQLQSRPSLMALREKQKVSKFKSDGHQNVKHPFSTAPFLLFSSEITKYHKETQAIATKAKERQSKCQR